MLFKGIAFVVKFAIINKLLNDMKVTLEKTKAKEFFNTVEEAKKVKDEAIKAAEAIKKDFEKSVFDGKAKLNNLF